ncbi:MAG: CvpA family protein [Clostridia bacterium]|nr:CvpA family protein [Clostridia bacterium]
MGIILDLIILAIVAVSVYSSARYGFIRTVIELAGYIIAVILISTITFSDTTAIFYRTLLLIVLIVLTKFAAKFINKLFSFSIIGKVNGILGGLLGVPKGILLALAFCLVAFLVATISKDGFLIFSKQAIEESNIFKQILSLEIFK